MNGLSTYTLRPTVLRFRGDDHMEFLHNQGTQDLRGQPGFCRYSLWLDHQGKIKGDGFVLRLNARECLLVSYYCSAQELINKFERHIIADDVELVDESDEWRLHALEKGGALPELPEEGFSRDEDQILFYGRLLGRDGLECLAPAGAEIPQAQALTGRHAVDAIRIEAGIIAIPQDTDNGSLNPLECRLGEAVSFSKGCFLGQEVVARAHRLNRLSRRIVQFKGELLSTDCPYDLHKAGKLIGRLTSVTEDPDRGFLALGWLKSKYGPGRLDFDGFTLEVQELAGHE